LIPARLLRAPLRPRYGSSVGVDLRRILASSLVAAACGAGGSPRPVAGAPTAGLGEIRRAAPASARPGPFTGGSSDGTTCEQAREQYTEEINLQAGSSLDLRADDFAAVLNNGSYLDPCEVPGASRIRICAAVQNGRAVGVTVLLDPPSPTLEICVAGQVRQLAFPSSAKMDFVNVNF
jgi:eukaryotic-like serine/threonine-protein kinase